MTCYRLWTTLETKLVKMGILPKGRSLLACRVFCRRNGVKFPGKKTIEDNDDLINEIEKKFSQKKGHDMKKETKKTITASVKDAKPQKKLDGEKPYVFCTVRTDRIYFEKDSNIRTVNDISDLVASIEAHGIINPITVTPEMSTLNGKATGKYNLVAGFRRFAAAKKLNLESVPCHVINNGNVREIALSENVNRINMTPYEECKAVKNLVNKKNTVQQIARKFGRTLRWVLVRKKLADAGEEVLEKVKNGDISLDAAAKLADLPDDVFKEEMTACYRTDDYFVKGVLDRYHKDLSRAPFEHEACLKCDKCSACQKDLFDGDPKAYCLDPVCWALKTHDAAEKKVEDLKADGVNARIGEFESWGIKNDDDAFDYEIKHWDSKNLKKAEEAGIKQRVLVDGDTAKTYKYYDKRDMPDFHEETEEERQERESKNEAEREFNNVKNDLYEENLAEALKDAIECEGASPDLLTLAYFAGTSWLDDSEEIQKEILGGKETVSWFGIENIPEGFKTGDFAKFVCDHVADMLDCFDASELEKLYKMVCVKGDDPARMMPTDEEVNEEIAKRNAAKKSDGENNESENESQED